MGALLKQSILFHFVYLISYVDIIVLGIYITDKTCMWDLLFNSKINLVNVRVNIIICW